MPDRIHYLLRKYLNNSCTSQELEELFQFFSKLEPDSPMRTALTEILLEQQVTDQPHRRNSPRMQVMRSDQPSHPVARKTTPVLKWAAMLVVIAGAAVTFHWLQSPQNVPDTSTTAKQLSKQTARSEYKYLLLPDSSQVWLNAESQLSFPATFSDSTRHVTLIGEAYFDVKHADRIPFIIHTGSVTTTVLGTAFNIKAYPGGEKITVTVTRGKVKVDYGKRHLALLTRGQELSIDTTRQHFKEKVLPAKSTETWQEGVLSYDDYALADILADLQRVYDVKIRVEDPSINRLRISTSFRREQGIEQALEILSTLTDKSLTRTNDEYLIQ